MSVTDTASPRSRSRRRARVRTNSDYSSPSISPPVWPGLEAGHYRPLSPDEQASIHEAVLEVLEITGLGDAPDFVADPVIARGGKLDEHGRLLFPRSLVEEAIAGLARSITLFGQRPGHEMELCGSRVYTGTGGAAPSILDLQTRHYRPALLRDLHDAARLADTLDNVHFFSRSMVATDIDDPLALDVNTAYACLAGTTKHVMVSASQGAHVSTIASMCHTIAGDADAFAARPFLSLNINHVVPPLRFIPEACEVMREAARLGIPFFVNSFDQAGASSPASLAGSLVQAIAETLAGMVFAWVINPDCKAVFGPRPLITDLRTGAMTGGCGEQAVVMAGAIQMAQYYGLPNSCIAGATDAKVSDAQSGYEKALTVTLAAQAGCNVITQACGMQAALMGCSLESYVMDNDMLGAILRSVRGIEASEVSSTPEIIAEAVRGEGHFLGNADTYARMKSDYLYPDIADRQSAEEWEAAGQPLIAEEAARRVMDVLGTHYPTHLSDAVDDSLRTMYDIKLPVSSMQETPK